MNNNEKQNYINNEKGQALLFVVVALTVALAIGMSVSSRTISSVRRSTSTDTSSRVYSSAEGGVEFFLRQPHNVLQDLADNGGSACPAGSEDYDGDTNSCVISYTSATGDNISSRAIVNVSTFTYNNPAGSSDHYWFNVESGDVKEVRLNGTYAGQLRLCWASQATTSITPDLYVTYYNDASGVLNKVIMRNSGHTNQSTESNATYIDANAVNLLDYTDCAQITIPSNNVLGLRIKAMYAPAKVGVFVVSGNLPTQGYVIRSTGELIENETIKTVKKLKVYKSYKYMPGIFDYAIYSNMPLGL